MSRLFAAPLAAVFLVLGTIPTLASSTDGLVRGNVIINGAPHADVTITIEGSGSLLTAKTDARGNFVFPVVPFGTYEIIAHYPGVPEQHETISVTSGSLLTVNFQLGKLKTIAVTHVSAGAGASGTPVNVTAITRQQLAALPQNNSLNQVIDTVPGVVKFSYNEPVANGFHGLTYYIDGAPFPQATTSNFAEIIDPKDVDSVEVYTGDYPAEYGGQRMGAVVNIITNRANSLKAPEQGFVTGGVGNYGQTLGELDEALKVGAGSLFFNGNVQRSSRGIDTPTYAPIHDNSSQGDEFLRYVTPVGERDSLSFDFSNQVAQFQIPINTTLDVNLDPQVSPSGTNDTQNEYTRFANANFTMVSKDGNGIFSVIPWLESSRVVYGGDLTNDVQQVLYPLGDSNVADASYLASLQQDQHAGYQGIDVSEFRASTHHAWKVGVQMSREEYSGNLTIAAPASSGPSAGPPLPYTTSSAAVSQPGSLTGIYAEDTWSPSREVSVNYGLRYDASTGFTSGHQISPRISVNVAPDGKNVLHFYYGRMYAAPQLQDDRGACVASIGCNLQSIPYDLQPERDSFFEMGVEHVFNSTIKGYVNAFKRTAVNILDTTQLLNTPIFAVYNNAIGDDIGFEGRLEGNVPGGDNWFVSLTESHSEAGDISGGLFLFCPPGTNTIAACNVNPSNVFTAADLSPEDHDETWEQVADYTHRFGLDKAFFASLEDEYGSGFPVYFQAGASRLPAHLTFDLSIGKTPGKGPGGPHSLGFDLDVENVLSHQYVIKSANGFNTTQIAPGRTVLFRITEPF